MPGIGTSTISRRSFVGAGALATAAVAAGCTSTQTEEGSGTGSAATESASEVAEATMVFRNGTIQTMVEEDDVAEALAIQDNQIVYVGDADGVEDYIGEDTTVVDLDGGMVIPGFMDGHIHAPGEWVTVLYEIYLTAASSIEEYEQIITEFIENNPDEEVYGGGSFMLNLFAEEDGTNNGPTKDILDAICSDKPIVLTDTSYHGVWVNSKALELAGITADTEDPTGGIISRDDDGEPSGYLTDSAADLVTSVVYMTHTDEEYQTAIAKYQESAAAYGITGITNITQCDTSYFAALDEAGELNLRMRVLPTITPGTSTEDAIATIEDLAQYDSDMIATGTAKIYSDGVTEGGTAVMLEPYLEAAGMGDDWYGESVWDYDEFSDMVVALDAAGVQLHVHAIGDGAVQNTLDAYERAIEENGERDDRRNTITHVCAITDDDIQRVADTQTVCALQFLWMYYDALCELEVAMVGEERAMAFYPVRNMIDAGCIISGASDGPVTGYAPLEEIEVAVTRNSPYEGEEDTDMTRWPEQAITAYEALEAYTSKVAFENFMEDRVGSIEVGKLADLTVLSQNILECDPTDISNTEVLYTISDGRVVYQA